MKDFSRRLNYTFGNEDPETEQKALQIDPENRVLCITASGDRPLNLLVNRCKEIMALDVNPLQNHLLHLKTSAMLALDYDRYLSFLGAKSCMDRDRLFRPVLSELSSESAVFWKANKKWICKGILYQGRIESITKFTAFLLGTKKNKQLFKFNCLNEQKEFVAKNWDTPFLRKTFALALSPKVSKHIFRDPGLYSHLAPEIDMGTYLYERILNLLNVRLAKESVLLSLILQGWVETAGFPPYLTQEGVASIKERLPLLKVHTEDVIHYLKKQPAGSIDRFSLSDIASYMPQDTFDCMIEEVYRTASPGSRFCIRQLSSNHRLPSHLKDRFQRDYALEKDLEDNDHCFVYRFMTGTIKK